MVRRVLQTFFRKAHSLNKIGLRRHKKARKSIGQSMLEFAIALPILILLFSGLVEFGFILNYYLSLLDATREAARYYSNYDPFNTDLTDNISYYQNTAGLVKLNLEPKDVNDTTRKIILDRSTDDVIVSVFNVSGSTISRYPASLGGEFHLYNNVPSGIDANRDIRPQLISGAPNTAILVVEVYYGYHPTFAIPTRWFNLPNPVMLHAYTMMPMPPISFAYQPQDQACKIKTLEDASCEGMVLAFENFLPRISLVPAAQ